MKTLALDPATRTGWAVSFRISGTWDLSVRRDESGGMRLVRFRAKLDEVHAMAGGLALVVYEAARHVAPGMQGALVVQSELQGVLKLWCEQNRVNYRGYSPSEIKKHGTGKGNAGKEAMIAAAQRITTRPIVDDNEADALVLLSLAMADYPETCKGGNE